MSIKAFAIKTVWTFFNLFSKRREDTSSRHGFGEFDYNPLIMEEVAELLAPKAGESILDAGCGDGFICAGLHRQGMRVCGVDFVQRFERQSGASYLRADISSLPFEDGSFDKIICYSVFQYVGPFEKVEAIIKELSRVLKPGGKILIGEMICKKGYFNDYLRGAKIPFLKKWFHYLYLNSPLYPYYYYPLNQWEQMFERRGFEYRKEEQNEQMPYHANMRHVVLRQMR